MKMLDEQAKQGSQVLDAQTTHQKDYLKSQAEQQKKQFVMQIDMEVPFAVTEFGFGVCGIIG